MKNVVPLLAALALAAPLAVQAQIANPPLSPKASVMQRVGLTDVTITYSRPSARGRAVFGDSTSVVPAGQRWRTGANATTSIKFADDVTVEGVKVPAGEYGLYTVPGPAEWRVVLNKSLQQGADVAGFKDEQNVASFSVKPYKLPARVETFTIGFTDLAAASADVALEWETTGAKFKVVSDVEGKIMAQINERVVKAAAPTQADLALAATYYYDNKKDLKQALTWMQKANTMQPKYFNLGTEAKIRLQLKDYKGAIAAAEQSKKLALENTPPNPGYAKADDAIIAEAKKGGK